MPKSPRPPLLPPCEPECPVRRAAEVLDGKWILLIVRELLDGERRFGQLRGALPGVSAKVLAAQLRHLEGAGLVDRQVRSSRPLQVTYELNDLGRTLGPLIDTLAQWGTLLGEHRHR